MVTGEVGTGKTLLLRCLLRLLRASKDVAYAYLFNSRLAPTEFLQYIVSDFGLRSAGKNKGELLLELGQFLIARGAKKLTTVLIIDEAHHFQRRFSKRFACSRTWRRLTRSYCRLCWWASRSWTRSSTLSTFGNSSRELPFARIWVRSMQTRHASTSSGGLQIAGADPDRKAIFSAEAMAAIFHHSQGLPRLINSISENALIAAYARQLPVVPAEIVDDVAREFRLDGIGFPEKNMNGNGTGSQRAMGARPDVVATMQRPANGAHAGRVIGVEAKKI